MRSCINNLEWVDFKMSELLFYLTFLLMIFVALDIKKYRTLKHLLFALVFKS